MTTAEGMALGLFIVLTIAVIALWSLLFTTKRNRPKALILHFVLFVLACIVTFFWVLRFLVVLSMFLTWLQGIHAGSITGDDKL